MSRPIVLIGAGGVGAPAAWALCEAGVRELVIVDEDRVETSNLHRQILFEEHDVGRPKLTALAEALTARLPGLALELVEGRALPDTVMGLCERAGVLLDATDNYPSRFLLADAARLSGRPVVHAAAAGWQATVLASPPHGQPCYRCLFEDIPWASVVDGAVPGIVGPVCGVAGALGADRALRLWRGDASAAGQAVSYDGLRDRLRSVSVAARPSCPLCGPVATISSVEASRYARPGGGS